MHRQVWEIWTVYRQEPEIQDKKITTNIHGTSNKKEESQVVKIEKLEFGGENFSGAVEFLTR